MPIGDVDVLFTADDASVLRALAAQERAVMQSAGKMEREWNTASEKAGRQFLGFSNIGKAAMYGVGASIAAAIKLTEMYGEKNRDVAQELTKVKAAGESLFTFLGRGISGFTQGLGEAVTVGGGKLIDVLTKMQNVGADILVAATTGRVNQGESAADYDRARKAQEAMDKKVGRLTSDPDTRRRFELARDVAYNNLNAPDEFERRRREAGLISNNADRQAEADFRAGRIKRDELLAKTATVNDEYNAKIKQINGEEAEAWMRANDEADRQHNILVGAALEADRLRAASKETLKFKQAEAGIDVLRAQGSSEAADRAEVELNFAKQALDVARDAYATEKDRKDTLDALAASRDAAIGAINDRASVITSGRGLNAGVGSAGIAGSVLATAGRRDVSADIQKGNQLLREIKDILQRNPGTATFGR